jgi:hypothetical protein
MAITVVSLGVALTVVGCSSSTTTGKDKMGGEKMGSDKMGGGKMDGGKMDD